MVSSDREIIIRLVLDLYLSLYKFSNISDGSITGWTNTAEEAERVVNELSQEHEQHGDKLIFTTSRKSRLKVFTILDRVATIDISLSIPKDLKISLQINSGEITASNT